MNTLVTGGAGFIGSHIADELLRAGHKVIVVDDLSNGYRENVPAATQFYCASILDEIDVPTLARDHQIDIIFHQAAQPSLRRSIDDPEFDAEVNILGTLRMIMLAKKLGAHLVFASTSAVYAPDARPPFFEDDGDYRPNLPYGIAKLAAEMYIKNSGVSYTILRYGNVYGPRQAPVGENQLIPHCIRFLNGEESDFAINGDGEQTRDFIFVKDIARANLNVGGLKMHGTFNCGTGKGTSVNRVCEILAQIAGKPNEFLHRASKVGEAQHSVLETHRIQRTGWQPLTRLENGLRHTWEWHVGNYARATDLA